MSYIPDLATVSYTGLTGPIRAVGWLESSHPFIRRSVEPEFVRRLMALVERPIWAFFSLGMYWCSLCEAEGRCGPDYRSSQAVLLVPAPNCVYETPIWIGHYVLGHSYHPPVEFCDAVKSCPEPGSDEFRSALVAHVPELANLAAPEGVPFFIEWADGAKRTLQADLKCGSEKHFLDAVARAVKLTPSQQRQEDLEFYDRLGSEEADRPCKKGGCRKGAVKYSPFCRKHHFEQIQHRECPFDH